MYNSTDSPLLYFTHHPFTHLRATPLSLAKPFEQNEIFWGKSDPGATAHDVNYGYKLPLENLSSLADPFSILLPELASALVMDDGV